MDWDQKSFLFSEDEYEQALGGEDGTGYGSGPRNLDTILSELHNNDIMLFAIGIDKDISKRFPSINSTSRFSFTASLIKNSDYVIGPEGCLTNMSAALKTPTIITTDYIHQMFGPKGILWKQSGGNLNKLENRVPFLGPCKYFPNGNHTHLSPYLSDREVGNEILKIVTNGR